MSSSDFIVIFFNNINMFTCSRLTNLCVRKSSTIFCITQFGGALSLRQSAVDRFWQFQRRAGIARTYIHFAQFVATFQ